MNTDEGSVMNDIVSVYLYRKAEYGIPISLKAMTHQRQTHTLYPFEDPDGQNAFSEPLTQS